MRVAYINTTASPQHAPARIMLQTAAALRSNGGDALIAYGRGKEELPAGTEGYSISSPTQVVTHALMSRMGDSEGLHSRRATAALGRKLADWKPEIVHLHNLHGHYLNIQQLVTDLKILGIPIVATLHDCWTFTGHCAFFEHAGCSKWMEGCTGKCPLLHEYPKSFTSRASENLALKKKLFNSLGDRLTLVSVSQALNRHVAQSALGGLRHILIENGVDTSFFSPTPEAVNRSGEKMILAVANRWDNRKNLHHIEQFAQHLKDNERIVVAGRVDRRVKGIEYAGNASPEQLRHLYRRSSVLVNPSGAESFGLVTAEAMACGTPVVALNSCIEGAIIADTSNPKKLREGIEEAFRTPREEVRRKALAYSSDAMTRCYLDLYREILSH